MTTTDTQREQARLRQARKRQHGREARLDLQATTIAERMSAEWRAEFLDLVHRERERAACAKLQIDKALLAIPVSGRDAFLARNRHHMKVSVSQLRNRFVRQKTKEAHAEQNRLIEAYEGEAYEGEADDGWNERYPGSPPKWVVEWIAKDPQFANAGEKRVDTDAVARQRAARRLAAACMCHSACITSRPEYALVSTTRLVLTRLRGRVLEADPIPKGPKAQELCDDEYLLTDKAGWVEKDRFGDIEQRVRSN